MPSDATSRGRLPLAALLATALVSGCLDPIPTHTLTQPSPGVLAGAVADLCTGAPLAEVLVTPVPMANGKPGRPGAATVTDAQGAYRLEGLAQGDWQLMFAKQSFQSAAKTAVVTAGNQTRLDLILAPVPEPGAWTATQLDVLFVVDNSGSMEDEQKGLAGAFPRFMDTLLESGFVLDLRVGVISTDLGAANYGLGKCATQDGDAGVLQSTPRQSGCTPPADPYIALVGRESNVPGDLINEAFGCIARLGVNGCGFEQPLGAVLRAVDGSTNPGFPRPDAVLAVVVLTDEDDCTASDGRLFDPTDFDPFGPLGPLSSFRCFEHGVTCDINDRHQMGPRKGCTPRSDGLLLSVESFVSTLTQGRTPARTFFAAITGPSNPVVVGGSDNAPKLLAACETAATLATPAIRLHAVVERLAPRSAFANICFGDLGAPLADIARQIAATTLLGSCGS